MASRWQEKKLSESLLHSTTTKCIKNWIKGPGTGPVVGEHTMHTPDSSLIPAIILLSNNTGSTLEAQNTTGVTSIPALQVPSNIIPSESCIELQAQLSENYQWDPWTMLGSPDPTLFLS